MKTLLIWVYNYLTWKPENGAVCGGLGYILAIKTPAISDATMKTIATLSAIATCLISCITLLSLLIKCCFWCHKTVTVLIVKFKKPQ